MKTLFLCGALLALGACQQREYNASASSLQTSATAVTIACNAVATEQMAGSQYFAINGSIDLENGTSDNLVVTKSESHEGEDQQVGQLEAPRSLSRTRVENKTAFEFSGKLGAEALSVKVEFEDHAENGLTYTVAINGTAVEGCTPPVPTQE
jgi:hypothetical protein